jgi:hypothetical protein
MGKLPEIRKDLREFEKQAGISVYVIVRVKGFKDHNIGRYLHGLEEWQVYGHGGEPPEVIEWWPLPEFGTGEPTDA